MPKVNSLKSNCCVVIKKFSLIKIPFTDSIAYVAVNGKTFLKQQHGIKGHEMKQRSQSRHPMAHSDAL